MGVENNIPEGWKEVPLKEILLKSNQGVNTTTEKVIYSTKGHGVVKAQDILERKINFSVSDYVDKHEYARLSTHVKPKLNDILYSNIGSKMGNAAKVKSDFQFIIAWNVLRLQINTDEADVDFLVQLLNSKTIRRAICSLNSSSTMPFVSGGVIRLFEINLPPLSEQKAIAKVLTAFDDKIELLQAQNKTLETMAQTIFKEWFGKYQIGDELPEGWRVTNINEFIESSIGGDYGKETTEGDYTEETICLRGTDLPDMKTGTPKKAPIRFLKASKLERCKVENGDIVVEISGGTENQSTGRVMYINERILNSANHPMTCVNFCRIIRPLKLEYSYFLYSLFDYLYTRKVFFNWENGTTGIKNLNLKALLEDFDLFIPENGDLILDFNKNVKASFNKIQTNNSQIQSLTKTRDTLLPKLMSGQVRVKNLKHTADA